MHRTTITLEGTIERELRKLAASEKRSFTELVNDLLKKGLQIYRKIRRPSTALKWHTAGGVPQLGFDPSNRSTYLDSLSRTF